MIYYDFEVSLSVCARLLFLLNDLLFTQREFYCGKKKIFSPLLTYATMHIETKDHQKICMNFSHAAHQRETISQTQLSGKRN